jgi:thioredoxin-related protein
LFLNIFSAGQITMLYRFAAILTFALVSTLVHPRSLSAATDWELVGEDARARGLPVMVVVTGDDCGHCARMRREFLSDPAVQTLLGDRAVTHEFHRDTGGKINDFDGERLRARLFLSRYGIFATPTLLFLDAEGRPLAPALVGYSEAQAYRQLVAARLSRAQATLDAGAEERTRAVLAGVAR